MPSCPQYCRATPAECLPFFGYADVCDSHARIQRQVESNIIGIFFWDLNGGITEANDAFLNMIGYSRQDLADGQIRWATMTPAE